MNPAQKKKKQTIHVFFNKTLWHVRASSSWRFYCPLCRVERRISMRPRPSVWHFFQLSLLSVVFTLAAWPWFSWKGLVSFLPFWTGFEIIFRLRLRASIPCSQCGFDPYLYLDNPERAKKEIDLYWRNKFAEKGIPYPEKEMIAPLASSQNLTESPPHS